METLLLQRLSSASGFLATVCCQAKVVVSQMGPSYFSFILERRDFLARVQDSRRWGWQKVFHLDGQGDAFPEFVLLSRERPGMGAWPGREGSQKRTELQSQEAGPGGVWRGCVA